MNLLRKVCSDISRTIRLTFCHQSHSELEYQANDKNKFSHEKAKKNDMIYWNINITTNTTTNKLPLDNCAKCKRCNFPFF